MAKSREINFIINGTDNLSGALKNASDAIKRLVQSSKAAGKLQGLQGQLKQVEAFKNLSRALAQSQRAYQSLGQDQSKIFKQRQEAAKQLESMRASYARLQTVFKDNRRSMDAAQRLTMQDALKSARNELKAQENSLKALDRAYDSTGSSVAKLRSQLQTQQSQLSALRSSVNVGNLGAQEAQLRAQIQSTTQALNQEIAALERRNQIHANFAAANQNLSNAWANFQNALDTGATLMNPFKDAADNAMTFEKAMSRVKSLTQMRNIRAGDFERVNREMAELTAQAEALGMATEFTRTEIAQAQGYFGMAGWSHKAIMAVMKPALDLASISGDHNLARTADVLSDDMTAFGIKAGESYRLAGGKVVDGAQYFTDAFAYAITQANLDRESFHEAWKYNAPVAHGMRLSLGEAIAQNMVLANSGLKGSMSGTSLRQFWVRLAAPPKAAVKALQDMGLEASDASKAMLETEAALKEAGSSIDDDLFSKIQKVEQHYQKLSKESPNAATGWLKALTGQTALSGVQSLFDLGKLDEARRYAQEIDSGFAEGWAADTAAINRDNTQTAVEYLKSALDALEGAAGRALLPAIKSAADAITPLVANLAQWVSENPRVVQGLAAIATAASAAVVAISGVSLALAAKSFMGTGLTFLAAQLSSVASVVTGLGTALRGSAFVTALSGAFTALRTLSLGSLVTSLGAAATAAGPVALAVMAIAAAGLYAYQNWDKVSGALSRIGSSAMSIIGPAFERVGSAFGRLFDSLSRFGEASGLTSLISAIGSGLVQALLVAISLVTTFISTMAGGLADLLTLITNVGSGLVESFSLMMEGDFGGAASKLAETGAQAAEDFKNVWVNALDNIAKASTETQAMLKDFNQTTVNSRMQAGFSDSTPAWSQTIAAQIDPSQVVQPVADVSTAIANALTQVQQPAESTGQSLMNLPASIDTATTAVDGLSAALPTPTEGLLALGPAASSAASALEGAAARISSLKIEAPQVTVTHQVLQGAPVAANASGGIYNRGSFLTTLAESSAEAAIPIDNTARAKSLWMQTGDLLGMFDGGSAQPISLTMNLTINGAGDNARQQVEDAWTQTIKPSLEEQLRQLQHEQRRRSFA